MSNLQIQSVLSYSCRSLTCEFGGKDDTIQPIMMCKGSAQGEKYFKTLGSCCQQLSRKAVYISSPTSKKWQCLFPGTLASVSIIKIYIFINIYVYIYINVKLYVISFYHNFWLLLSINNFYHYQKKYQIFTIWYFFFFHSLYMYSFNIYLMNASSEQGKVHILGF